MRRHPRGVLVLALMAWGAGACENATVPDLPPHDPVSLSDPSEVDAVVFLLGDGGATVTGRSPVLEALKEDVETWSAALARDSAVSIIYPGDIVYPLGVREHDHPDFPQDSARLWNQIDLVAGPAAREHNTLGLFLAGNHDWGNASGDEGLDRLLNLEEALARARRRGPRVALLPEAGRPGPVVRDLRRNVRLIFLDTHWFLQSRSPSEKDEFFARVAEALATAGDRHVIMVQHHPWASAGPHGALVPGPRALGIPFLLKQTGTLVQDLQSPVYDELHRRLRLTFRDTGLPPLIYAAGHDHSLQVLTGRGDFAPSYVLVSGAGSKITPITQTEGMRYGAARPGYMMLLFRADDSVDLFVVAGDPGRLTCSGLSLTGSESECMEAGIDSLDIAFSARLAEAGGEAPPLMAQGVPDERPSTPWWDPARILRGGGADEDSASGADPAGPSGEDSSAADSADPGPDVREQLETGPPPAVARRQLLRGVDSVTARPGEVYPASRVRRFFFGDLNRHLWEIRFQVPVLDLDSLGGGVTVEEVSGGKQTLGLRLRGADGVTYQFRSIVKDGARVLPGPLAGSPLGGLVQDQMAAQFPLGAAVVAELLEAAGAEAVKPVPVIMPDDERLGEYREAFAGRMGWIEVRPDEGEDGGPGFAGSSRIFGTDDLYERLAEDPASRVDGPALLRVRLVDMLVGDWDRHADQWRWAGFEENGSTRWVPIPEDRDWAFGRIDGLLPRLASLVSGSYPGFGDTYPDIEELTHQSEDLERRLLSSMARTDYLREARDLSRTLTDSVLAAAVDVLPPEYLEVERERLLGALRQRRNALIDLADAWFEHRAREVDVRGTTGVDVFEIVGQPAGEVTVRVRSASPEGPVRYERTFRPEYTETIRLHLTEGDDRVVGDPENGPIDIERVELEPPGGEGADG